MMDIQLKEVIQHLEQQGYDCIPIDKLNREFIILDILTTICGKEMRLRCKFPNSFPYSFPKIYILMEFYKNIAPLPHIDDDGYICTFDNNISFPNHKNPIALVEESIKKAIKIIEDGINGTNKEDFIEEFNSYWNLELNTIENIWILCTLNNQSQLLYFWYDKEYGIYVNDTVEQLIEYLKYAKDLSIKEKDMERCLYLSFKNTWYPPYPKTNKEIFLKVKEDKEAFKPYHKYLKNRTNNISLIIFSQKVKEKKYFAGWAHGKVQSKKSFRKGKLSPEFAYLMQHKDEEIIRFNVNQIDRRRLFNRGGDGNIISNCKVSITGCGSIGSFLIQILVELSIDNFTFIDNDFLSSENIARHTCGTSDIGKPKTKALKEQLFKHYPYIKCESILKNALEVLKENIDVFNQCDLNFVVVGHIPVEMRFLELLNKGKITKPLIIIWVEPFLLGGHAIIVQNKQDIESLLYDEEYRFKYSILSNGGEYTKKEAGCHSTYIPYSAFEAKQFIYSFMDYFYSNYMVKKTEGNYLFSWCGNLKWARKENIKISDLWLSKQKRSVKIMRLDINDTI